MGDGKADSWVQQTLGVNPAIFSAQPSSTKQPATMGKAEIVNFLARHRFGPPQDANAGQDACVIDGGPSTLSDVGKMIDAEAKSWGQSVTADRDQIIAGMLQDRKGGQATGGMIAKHVDDGENLGFLLSGLQKQDMVSVLDALETIRAAKKLDAILDLVRNQLRDKRLEVAILSVQHHLGGEWEELLRGLSDEDASAIRGHIFGSIEGGDSGDIKQIKHGDEGFSQPDASDDDWIKQFLAFVHAGPDPLGDGTGTTCSFDGVPMPIQRTIDSVVEQATFDGRSLKPGQVAEPLAKLAAQRPPSKPGTVPAPQFSISYGFPATGHITASGQTSADQPRGQVAYTGTIALHPDNAPGLEVSWTVQVAYTLKTWKVQQILQGPQAAWAWSFLDGALQVQVIANALSGLANSDTEASGKVAMMPATQIGASGQVTYAILGKKVLIGFQMGPSVTATQGQPTTADMAVMGFLQVQW
ncbi:MAG: hypothetical protein JOZ05_07110 [Acetobacteraceae bacterium]|nr:hypothetical protein [Acetobacteraceae bacterium]